MNVLDHWRNFRLCHFSLVNKSALPSQGLGVALLCPEPVEGSLPKGDEGVQGVKSLANSLSYLIHDP